MLKILHARLQPYVNQKLPDVQVRFRKGIGTRDQIANICWIIEKAREFQKNIYFCFIDCAKAFDCVNHNKLWKTLRDGNTRPSYLSSEKPVCRPRSNNRLVQNWERRTTRLYIVTLFIWLLCRTHLAKCWAAWVTSWNQDCWEKYQQFQIYGWYHSNSRRWRGN